MMKIIMFQERFAGLVESGAKTQTIRQRRKVPIQPGDVLSLRKWTGSAYRSKQWEIKKVVCRAIQPVEICHPDALKVNGVVLRGEDRDKFAVADGFTEIGTNGA
jgi:uncharacterized protein YqfB (UPF0267 family)